ncbi:MAG: hypothetical protein ACRDRL_00875, partial [Sciscionella sp.]
NLVQLQVFLSMADTEDAHRAAVVQLVLTSTVEQFEQVVGDFQEFVSTVRPEQDATTDTAPDEPGGQG